MSEKIQDKPSSGEVLWLDFDGTAVEKTAFVHWRNPLKYPLRRVPGVTDFLDGFIEAGGRLGGVTSRRPDVLPRKWATERSIQREGLAPYLGALPRILAGSEGEKADAFIEQVNDRSGFVDDYPNKIGRHLLEHGRIDYKTIVLGAVATHSQTERVEELVDYAIGSPAVKKVTEVGAGYSIETHRGNLTVVSLAPYSNEEGSRLHDIISTTRGAH